MTSDYNLLKHVYLSCETLLNIAEFDSEEDEVRENLVKHRLHIKSDPRDLIATTKFVAKYGFFPPKVILKLLENVNLSSDQLFHLMLLCLELNDTSEAKSENRTISLLGSKNPSFDREEYSNFLIKMLDVFPVRVAVEPMAPKHVLFRLLKHKIENHSAMYAICKNPNSDEELLSQLANEFYRSIEGQYIASHDEQLKIVADHLGLDANEPIAKVASALIISGSEAKGFAVHLELKELLGSHAKYWKEYYDVTAFDD
jgi:hypothetical protein